MKQQSQSDPIVLDGEVVHSVSDITITADDLARVDAFMDELDSLLARLGIPPTGTIIDGTLAHPVTDSTRLLDSCPGRS